MSVKNYSEITRLCEAAINGDEDAIEELDLTHARVDPPSTVCFTKESLMEQYATTVATAAAAHRLGMFTLKEQCLKTMGYILGVAKAKKFKFPFSLQPKDVASVMLSLVNEDNNRVEFVHPEEGEVEEENLCQDANSMVKRESERVENVTPEVRDTEDANLHEDANAKVSVVKEDNGRVKIVHPEKEVVQEENLCEDANSMVKGKSERVENVTPKVQDTDDANLREDAKTMVSVVKEDNERAESDIPEQKSTEPHIPYSSPESHNKRRQCLMCLFFQTHLARHIASRHGFTSADIAVQVAKTDAKLPKDEKAPKFCDNPNSQRHQCTIGGCRTIVTRKSQHLRRYHKMKDDQEIKKASATFIKMTGTGKRRTGTGKRKAKSPASSPQKKKKRKITKPTATSTSEAKLIIQNPAKIPSKPAKKARVEEDVEDESSDESEESFKGDSDSDESQEGADPGYLNVEADLDKISSFAESDDDWPETGDEQKWSDYYFSEDSGKNTRQYFMSTFYRYLLHIEGGNHSQEQALLHTRQVHMVLDILEEDGKDLHALVARQGLNIWDVFAGPRLRNKTLTGNTIKTYCRSIEIFAKFIEKGLFYNKALLTDLDKAWIVGLQKRLPDYRASIHRRTAQQHTTRKVEEAYRRITPDDVRALEESKIAKEAIKILGKAAEHHVPSRNEFTTVRDYLLVTTLFENASRPGPLENAKVKRFYQATRSSNGRWIILVDEHKTTRHYGPAELALDDRLHGHLKIYLEYIRPAYVHSSQEEAIFIKDDGKQFAKGTIGTRVTALFKRAGIRQDVRVTATNIRKMHSDAASEMSPTKRRVQDHMKHLPTTAERNYVLKVNAEKAGKAHALMQKVIQGQFKKNLAGVKKAREFASAFELQNIPGDELNAIPENDDVDDPNDIPENEEQNEPNDIPQNKEPNEPNDIPKNNQQESEKDDDDDDEEEEEEEKEKEVEEKELHASGDYGLTSEEKSVVMTVYQTPIGMGRKLTMAEVRGYMRGETKLLRRYVQDQKKTRQIYDFVRDKTEFVRRTKDDLPEDEIEFVASITSTGQRRVWHPFDTENIHNKFEHCYKMPSKRDVVRKFQDDKVLSHILEREGKARCYEKVKTFFKNKSKS